MAPGWITPEEQIKRINSKVKGNDTFVCLGDVGNIKYIPIIKARRKILILGNHDRGASTYLKKDDNGMFDEVYAGPLFISDKILISHEPVYGLPWCLNIHGHDHNNVGPYREDCKHINLAANVCDFTPVNLGKLIKEGVLSDVSSIHRMTIDSAIDRKVKRHTPFADFNKQLLFKEINIGVGYAEDPNNVLSCELGEYTEYDSFEEKYIPSPEVKQLIRDTKYTFSARDKAAIVWNSSYCLYDKYEELRRIAIATGEEGLTMQVLERMAYDSSALEQFYDRRRGYIYQVNTREYMPDDNVIGYFKSAELAYEAGKRSGFAFQIDKHQIIEEGTEVIKPRLITSPLVESDVSRQIEEEDFLGAPVASVSFTEKGYISDYWSSELTKEDEIRVNTLSRERFENAYVVIPNPFEKGDRVQLIGTDLIGTVAVSQEDWKKYVGKALAPNAVEDWVDASITVRYPWDEWSHDHINPMFLSKVKELCNSFENDHYVISGHDSGAAYWIRPVKIRTSITDKLCDRDVTELAGEISIEEKFFESVLKKIFTEYLNMNLMCNKLRYTYEFSDEGRFVNGFETCLHYNFFTRNCMREIIGELKMLVPADDSYKAAVVSENCDKLAELIEKLIEANPENELYSVMAP